MKKKYRDPRTGRTIVASSPPDNSWIYLGTAWSDSSSYDSGSSSSSSYDSGSSSDSFSGGGGDGGGGGASGDY